MITNCRFKFCILWKEVVKNNGKDKMSKHGKHHPLCLWFGLLASYV